MKTSWVLALAIVALACLAAPQAMAQNLLFNAGFEDPVTSDGAPFVGFWEAFSGGAGAVSTNGSTMPRTGAQDLDLSIVNVANTFAGAFQDAPGLTPGQIGTFTGWHKLASGSSGGSEIRIEWRNSVSNVEISRTPNLAPVVGPDYSQFSVSAAVPAGADLARVVYAIQSFGGILNQNVLVDDVSFTAVPEPTSIALIGLGGLGMLARRRRRT